MDIFMKVLGTLIGLAFLYVGLRFLLSPEAVIKGAQKFKYKSAGNPQKQQINATRFIGILITLIGLYFTIIAVSSFFG